MSTGRSSPLAGAVWRHRLLWPLVTLVLLLAVNALFNASFLRLEWREGHLYGSLVDILKSASALILVSLGMTLVIATRGIDISVGAVVAIAAAVAAWMIGGSLVVHDGVATHVSRFPMWQAIAATLAVALLCGAWNGLLVSTVGMQPIIATLILMVAGRGVAQLITGGQIITIYYAPYFFIGNGYLLGLPFALFIAAAVFLGLLWLCRHTALGLFIQAVGINPSAAHVAGVPARRITFAVYVFCGFCAGAAGLVLSSNVKSADGNNAGMLMELDAILAVTLGGTALTGGRFSLAGSVIGALIIQTLTYAIYSLGVPPEVNLGVKAVVVFAVMLLQSAEFRGTVAGWARRPSLRGAP
jgi:simple sugar transport system permease protein